MYIKSPLSESLTTGHGPRPNPTIPTNSGAVGLYWPALFALFGLFASQSTSQVDWDPDPDRNQKQKHNNNNNK